jgi:hypothetical protein
MIIVTGVRSPQILGRGESIAEKRKQEISEELGIEFIEEE